MRFNNQMDYVIRILANPAAVSAQDWDALLAQQDIPSPFMQHAYLSAMHTSGSATPATGWSPHWVTLWLGDRLAAATVLYVKTHSYGEYVFDWAWANAYAEHGLDYYPKAICAVPFTPVPGARLLAIDTAARQALLQALIAFAQQQQLSSLHLLFTSPNDQAACDACGLMQRQTVQFHWNNADPQGQKFHSFDTFLNNLSQDKRKKIKQERRRVVDAGVTFRTLVGSGISRDDWEFFYRCYAQTYLEHQNTPYLTRAFFAQMQTDMANNWVMFVAERSERPIACSLIAVQGLGSAHATAYGRYWGAVERVDCLHFEACYYQPLSWCIANGVQRFEGGAQGEHKMARALMPVSTYSAHWLAHPAFADAVERYLERETSGIDRYLDHLAQRSPFKQTPFET
jgi:predicted N-acyltransferase